MNLQFRRWEGKGRQIVGFHGFGGSGLDFQPLAVASERKWTTVDLLGHGESPKSEVVSDYSLSSQLALVRDLVPCGAILLGYSMGARLALWLALEGQQDLDGLVLIGGRPGLSPSEDKIERQRWDHSQADSILELGTAAFMKRWATHAVLACAGHCAHLENQGAFLKTLDGWLDELER